LLRAQLEAGEFAPAIAAVERLPADARDAWLASIAKAQSYAGARRASLSTLGQLSDDRTRSRYLDEFAGRPGGGVQPDFDSLIELITSTIAPTSWSEVGGTGAVKPFPGGIYVDASGTLKRAVAEERGLLGEVRDAAAVSGANHQVRRSSPLRKISLPRLEREIQLRMAAGEPLDEEMKLLAGLRRVQYVLVYPETGDLVLAGPAGDWKTDREGRIVGVDAGKERGNGPPVLRLEDLVVVFCQAAGSPDGRFGCSITPTAEGLARTQAFARDSSRTPLKPGRRDAWLEQLRSQLGTQNIEINGIDPRTRVAQVLVEADYRMKLVGIGLEEGVMGVPSYLDMLKSAKSAPPMNVLRWWFTMNYKAVAAAPAHDAFEIRGQGVRVLSENELLTEQGGRVHTGNSDELNGEFAHNFTEHFALLAEKYPVYAELRNVFDLALVAALFKAEGLPERVGWHMACFATPGKFPVAAGQPPATVDTVINHSVVNKTQILAAISGGVAVEPASYVKSTALQTDRQGAVSSELSRGAPRAVPRSAWWWD
jgi:hypothetical protein